ncbi:hypothetical protein MOTE_10280 [Moorella thermoacetica]|uniref:Copper amine oxidase-like N-terminal domain-containing protein n=1 Tax=Neomoorella thermoacetica TaxID=1525 RepID=A0A1J5NWT9_NEOTH|nr:hypothetical protein MOTE_10280 [Moorella thermoacetica]
MVKKKEKILGVLCCCLIAALIATFAALKETQAAPSIRLVVDGREVVCNVPPFIKDGRTFVPLRFVAEALGYPVKWDEQNWTVYIGVPPEGMDLVTDLKPFRSSEVKLLSSSPVTITGIQYNHGYRCDYGEIYWNLSGKFKTLTFLTGCPDNSTLDSSDEIRIYGDGKLIGKAPPLSPSDGIKEYSFDVSGVRILQINSSIWDGAVTLINPRVK